MGILSLLRNAFGRSRKERTAEAETAERIPTQETPSAPTPAPTPGAAPEQPPARIPDPRPEPGDEHDLVTAAFDNVTVPKQPDPTTPPKPPTPEAEAAAAPKSTAAEPVPTASEPEPTAAERGAVADTEPEPVADPKSTAAEQEPTVAERGAVADTEPTAAEPKSTVAEPKPTAPETESAAPEQEAAAEPEPTAAEPEPELSVEAPATELKAEPTPEEPTASPEVEATPSTDELTPAAEAEATATREAEEVTEEAETAPEAQPEPVAEATPEPEPATKPTEPAAQQPAPATEPATQQPAPEAEPAEPTAQSGPADADGEDAPQGPPAADNETRTGGAGGNTPAEGEAEAATAPEASHETSAKNSPAPEASHETGAQDTPATPPHLTTAHTAAASTLEKLNLSEARADIYLVLDRSASMRPYYKDGSVKALANQTLALAAHLAEDKNVHVVFFSTELDGTADLALTDPEDKVDDLHAGLGRMGRTSYHAAVEAVVEHHVARHKKASKSPKAPKTPALVVFQTDGAPDAKTPATQSLTDAAKNHPSLFFSFVAFGEHDNKAFDYLRKLKTGNTSFFHAGPTPLELTDAELYEGVLATWRP
ncbi:VWA domain-containing protein [Streptomyces sp. NPDC002566]|uniref:VWA domain-containing protein n=1 Tax=Streptomyces sp. NPDC002566 TaxID=3364650 RepID=UPI0036A1066E